MDLLFVTSNPHKVEEIQQRVVGQNINIDHLDMKYGEPQADTIKDVARGSIANLIPVVSHNFFLEDSGIEIGSLRRFPGPYSSFVYQTIGWEGILKLLQHETDRRARFISVIGLYLDGEMRLFEGITPGHIAPVGKGDAGFGFDPVFVPEGTHRTYAQMGIEEKNNHSHRAKAFDKLVDYLVELQ